MAQVSAFVIPVHDSVVDCPVEMFAGVAEKVPITGAGTGTTTTGGFGTGATGE